MKLIADVVVLEINESDPRPEQVVIIPGVPEAGIIVTAGPSRVTLRRIARRPGDRPADLRARAAAADASADREHLWQRVTPPTLQPGSPLERAMAQAALDELRNSRRRSGLDVSYRMPRHLIKIAGR